jgi:hypothetical protein
MTAAPVPLRQAVESLCRLVYSKLVQSRKLRDDVRRQIGRDVALVKATTATLSPKAVSLGGVHDEHFLEAVRRLAGVVRMSLEGHEVEAALAGEGKLLADLRAIDVLLTESQKDFPMPESRSERWRNP